MINWITYFLDNSYLDIIWNKFSTKFPFGRVLITPKDERKKKYAVRSRHGVQFINSLGIIGSTKRSKTLASCIWCMHYRENHLSIASVTCDSESFHNLFKQISTIALLTRVRMEESVLMKLIPTSVLVNRGTVEQTVKQVRRLNVTFVDRTFNSWLKMHVLEWITLNIKTVVKVVKLENSYECFIHL